jgi:hypothetical protein
MDATDVADELGGHFWTLVVAGIADDMPEQKHFSPGGQDAGIKKMIFL